MELASFLQLLDQRKTALDKLCPLPLALVNNLREELHLRWTYHSNAIEGNTLTLLETKVVLEGITVGGKLLREHFEAINHRDAILLLEEIVQQQTPFSEWQIRGLHQLILKNIDDQNAGRYRTINVRIVGAEHIPPEALLVGQQMAELLLWYEKTKVHPIEKAAQLHTRFVGIHPFTDGNGRTARLLLNLELLKAGFPAVVLPVEKRLAYYQMLDTAHTLGDETAFTLLVAELVSQAFDLYEHALGRLSYPL
jgi:Fic family protein